MERRLPLTRSGAPGCACVPRYVPTRRRNRRRGRFLGFRDWCVNHIPTLIESYMHCYLIAPPLHWHIHVHIHTRTNTHTHTHIHTHTLTRTHARTHRCELLPRCNPPDMVDTLQNVHIPNRRTALPPRVRRGPPAGLYPPKHLRPLDGRPRCDRTLPPHHHVAISISIIATVRVVVVVF